MFPPDTMVLVEKVHAIKNISEEVMIEEGTPGELKNIIGTYEIFQLQKEIKISWGKGQLYVLLPDTDTPDVLEYHAEYKLWKDASGKKEYQFTKNEDGGIDGMDIYVHNHLTKNKE